MIWYDSITTINQLPSRVHRPEVLNYSYRIDHFYLAAIVEYVKDCCTLKITILPGFQPVFLQMTGIRAVSWSYLIYFPSAVKEVVLQNYFMKLYSCVGSTIYSRKPERKPIRWRKQVCDNHRPGSKLSPLSALLICCRFFVESRLLNRDVEVILEDQPQNMALVGTIVHPVRVASSFICSTSGWNVMFSFCDILGRFYSWSSCETRFCTMHGPVYPKIQFWTGQASRCRTVGSWIWSIQYIRSHYVKSSFSEAKANKLRIWKEYESPLSNVREDERRFTGKVWLIE